MTGRVFADITMSLDGFITLPNDSVEQPLGEGGERLHEWLFDHGLGPWRDAPPFHEPVSVLMHEARDPVVKADTTFTFVNDGIDKAVELARRQRGRRMSRSVAARTSSSKP